MSNEPIIVDGIDINDLNKGQLYKIGYTEFGMTKTAYGYFFGYERYPTSTMARFYGTRLNENFDAFPVVVESNDGLYTPRRVDIYLNTIKEIEALDWQIDNDMTIKEYMETGSEPVLKGGRRIRRKSRKNRKKSRISRRSSRRSRSRRSRR